MEYVLLFAVMWAPFSGLGAFIASAKSRPVREGLLIGLLFGPLGCLIEALLPTGVATRGASPARPEKGSAIDDPMLVEAIAGRYRQGVERLGPEWRSMSYHRRLATLKGMDVVIGREMGFTPTRLADLGAEARRSILG